MINMTFVCLTMKNKSPVTDLPKTTQPFLMLHVHPAAIKLELLRTVCLFHGLKKSHSYLIQMWQITLSGILCFVKDQTFKSRVTGL